MIEVRSWFWKVRLYLGILVRILLTPYSFENVMRNQYGLIYKRFLDTDDTLVLLWEKELMINAGANFCCNSSYNFTTFTETSIEFLKYYLLQTVKAEIF